MAEVSYGELKGRLRLLQAAFLSTFDRFTIAPMLVTIAADLRVSLAEVSATASLYFLLYGLMQPVWGMLSDRLGGVRVMRLALLGVLVPGLLSAMASTSWSSWRRGRSQAVSSRRLYRPRWSISATRAYGDAP